MPRKDRREGVKRVPYNVPDEIDLRLQQEDIDKHMKSLNEDGTFIPKKAAAMLRSGIRQVWMKAPNKLAFLLMNREPDYDENTKSRWKFKCNICIA